MADSTIGPQKAMRPVSLRASFRLDVSRAAPSSRKDIRDVPCRANHVVERIFPRASLTNGLRAAGPGKAWSDRDWESSSIRPRAVAVSLRGREDVQLMALAFNPARVDRYFFHRRRN